MAQKKENEGKIQRVKDPYFELHFSYFAPITVSLPLGGLMFCFIWAMWFQYDEVNKTMCKVQNFIPSISAITGAAPGRYVWRTCIALQATPRYAVGVIYYNYWMDRLKFISKNKIGLFKKLATVTFWTYTVENSCLLMVSFIGNFENYPLHEKIFVVFMVTSLFHQLFVLILFKWAHPVMTETNKYSYKWKKILFSMIMLSTAVLVIFFILHRFFCYRNAFSWFALAEYGIAVFNIAFHYTGTIDFPGYAWFVGKPFGSVYAITEDDSFTAHASRSEGDAIINNGYSPTSSNGTSILSRKNNSNNNNDTNQQRPNILSNGTEDTTTRVTRSRGKKNY